MNGKIFVLILSCVVSQVFSTPTTSRSCSEDLTDTDKENFVSDSTDFALNLYKKAAEIANDDSENIFFSPASVSLAVGMVNVGARGTTRSQIQDVLTPSVRNQKVHNAHGWLNSELNSEGKNYELHTANSAFLEKTLTVRETFLQKLQNCFQNELQTMDFIDEPENAREEINEWVEDHTNDRITDLIPRGGVDSDTRMVLTNALYFKGEWEKPFITENKADTYNSSFYPHYPSFDEETSQNVEMMNMKSYFLYHRDDDVQVLGVPYKNNELTMYFFLPSRSLKEFMQKLDDGSKLTELLDQVENRTVDSTIPKFTVSAELKLKNALKQLGIDKMFSKTADFTGITSGKKLKVSDAFHKAFIEVNENGTEAAAATGFVIAVESMDLSTPRFIANHPFLFLIRHESTGAILFMGSLNDVESLD